MADGIELATAYVTLIPSLKGAQKSIQSQLDGVDLSRSGAKIGKALSASMGKSISTDALKRYQQAVDTAAHAAKRAMAQSEDATKRVEIAQARLAEATSRYGEDSSRAKEAALKLDQAQRRSSEAAANAEAAQRRLAGAQEALAKASERAVASTEAQRAAYAKMAASASKASAQLAAASETLGRVGDGLESVGSGLTAGVTMPLVAAGASALTFAAQTASAAETAEMGFETLLGGAEQAKAMMAQLADFAATTPFELSGLQDAAKRMLAYGFSADEILPTLTAVGDATAALGSGTAGIESVTRAIGQMRAKGKVQSEEMLQLTEQGIPAWEMLAEAMGTDVAGAMEQVTDGAVTAQQGIDALVNGMERRFGGLMDKQSRTVEGLMSNLSDAIEQPLMSLKDTEGYDALADALSGVVDAAGPFVESLLPHLESGLEAASDVLRAASEAMDDFSRMSVDGQGQLLGMVGAAVAAGPALTAAGKGLGLLSAATGGLGGALGKGAEALQLAAGGAGTLGEALSAVGLGISPVTLGIAGVAAVAGTAFVAWQAWSAEQERNERLQRTFADVAGDAERAARSQAEGIGLVAQSAERSSEALLDLNESAADAMGDLAADSATLDDYVSTIERLGGQADLSATDQVRLKNAVKGYNDITGDSVEVTNAAAGELSKAISDIDANAEAWKRNAEAQALQKIMAGYTEERVKAEFELSKAQAAQADIQAELNRKNAEFNGIADKSSERAVDLATEIAALSAKYGEQQAATDQLRQNVDTLAASEDQATAAAAAMGESVAPVKAALAGMGDTAAIVAGGMGLTLDQLAVDLADAGISTEQLSAVGSENFAALAAACGGSTSAMVAMLQNYNSTPIVDKEGNVTADTTELLGAQNQVYAWNGQQLLNKDGKVTIATERIDLANDEVATWNGSGQLVDKTGSVIVDGSELELANGEIATYNQGQLETKNGEVLIAQQELTDALGNLVEYQGTTLSPIEGAVYVDHAQLDDALSLISSFKAQDGASVNLRVTTTRATVYTTQGSPEAPASLAPHAMPALAAMAPATASLAAPLSQSAALASDAPATFYGSGATRAASPGRGVMAAAPGTGWLGTLGLVGGAKDADLERAADAIDRLAESMRDAKREDFSSFLSSVASSSKKVARQSAGLAKMGELFERAGVTFSESFVREVASGTSEYAENLTELASLTDDQLQAVVDGFTRSKVDEQVVKLTGLLNSDSGLRRAFDATGASVSDFAAQCVAAGLDVEDVAGKVTDFLESAQTKVNDFATSVSDGFSSMDLWDQTGLDEYTQNLEHNIGQAKLWQRNVDKVFSAIGDDAAAAAWKAQVLEGGWQKYGHLMLDLWYKDRDEIMQVIDLWSQADEVGMETGTSVMQSILGSFREDQFVELGLDISGGMAKGIADGTGAVEAAMRNLCGAAAQAAKEYFLIASPSRLMRETFWYVGEGAALGIADSGDLMADRMRDACERVADIASGQRATAYAMAPAAAAGSGTTVNQTNNFYEPVQTPSQYARAIKRQATYGLAGARRR